MSWFPSRSYRGARGGSWGSVSQYARVANRGIDAPGRRVSNLGVRLVRRCM